MDLKKKLKKLANEKFLSQFGIKNSGKYGSYYPKWLSPRVVDTTNNRRVKP
jgi:hypothetical protein